MCGSGARSAGTAACRLAQEAAGGACPGQPGQQCQGTAAVTGAQLGVEVGVSRGLGSRCSVPSPWHSGCPLAGSACGTCPWSTPRSTGSRSTVRRSPRPGGQRWQACWSLEWAGEAQVPAQCPRQVTGSRWVTRPQDTLVHVARPVGGGLWHQPRSLAWVLSCAGPANCPVS